MSSSSFADEIGVQRSRISHILSGRNNPSLDIVQKILERWPDINPDWLLTGNGSMNREISQPKNQNIQAQDLFSSESESSDLSASTHDESDLNTEITEDVSLDSELPEEKSQKKPELSPTFNKEIEKVLIFYKDKTFSSYKPDSD